MIGALKKIFKDKSANEPAIPEATTKTNFLQNSYQNGPTGTHTPLWQVPQPPSPPLLAACDSPPQSATTMCWQFCHQQQRQLNNSYLPNSVRAVAKQWLTHLSEVGAKQADWLDQKQQLDRRLQVLFKLPWDIYSARIPLLGETTGFANHIGNASAQEMLLLLLKQHFLKPQPVAEPLVVAVVGPPCSGKTSLIKTGLSQALQRPLICISLIHKKIEDVLGDTHCYHDGDIVSELAKVHCMDPIIFLDDIDQIEQNQSSALNQLLKQLTNASLFLPCLPEIPIHISRCIVVVAARTTQIFNSTLQKKLAIVTLQWPTLQNIKKAQAIAQMICTELIEKMGLPTAQLYFLKIVLQSMLMRYQTPQGIDMQQFYENIIQDINQVTIQLQAKFLVSIDCQEPKTWFAREPAPEKEFNTANNTQPKERSIHFDNALEETENCHELLAVLNHFSDILPKCCMLAFNNKGLTSQDLFEICQIMQKNKDILRSLNLSKNTINDIAFITQFPNLTALNLSLNPLENDLTPLSALKKLQLLEIKCAQFVQLPRAIHFLPHLTRIYLNKNFYDSYSKKEQIDRKIVWC